MKMIGYAKSIQLGENLMSDFEGYQKYQCPKCNVEGFFPGLCTDCSEKILKEKYSADLDRLSEQPKTCPFCNQPAELHLDSHSDNLVFFSCSFYESCTRNDSHQTVEDALKAWNSRGYKENISISERENPFEVS